MAEPFFETIGTFDDFANPSPVPMDSLSPPGGERDGVRGAFGYDSDIVEKCMIISARRTASQPQPIAQ